METDLYKLAEAVKAVAMEAGSLLRRERQTFDRGCVEQKAAHDYVSYVDKASERLINPVARFVARSRVCHRRRHGCLWRRGILLGG